MTDLYPGHGVEARENHHESDAEDGDVEIFYGVGLHDESWYMITELMSAVWASRVKLLSLSELLWSADFLSL